MKVNHIAVLAFVASQAILSSASFADIMSKPFPSDGCVPGYTAVGDFVDENGHILDSAGWVVTPEQKVLTAEGQQVFLKKSCVGVLGTGHSGSLIWVGVGALVLGLAAGSTSSTGSTTGTN